MIRDKIMSGKFLFTIIAGIVFAYCAITKYLAPDKIYDVISIVVVAYFMRKDDNANPKT